jgi:gas vesicle protein
MDMEIKISDLILVLAIGFIIGFVAALVYVG